MKSNTGVKEGFKPRKQKPRKSRESLIYQHYLDPVGRTWLIITCLTAEQMMEGSEAYLFDRKFRDAGLRDKTLKQRVDAICPQYPGYYFEQTEGNELTANIYYDRAHKKCLYTNGPKGKGGIPARSNEHYTRSKWLRPCVPAVEQAFRRGDPLTLDEMRVMGGLG